ncbi:Nucleolar protein 16 [Ophidiomyces ophidiicola]|nr:Nucleolar protein 16 [Ophidiomyces ophidiicola]KAI1939591.1 Nucleolar protein 16 [Ophidiomyces ophidiicola]KAI1960252.1 Nucleolar protein 16 [Ophidiomyces ophidiicola]
MGRVLQKKKNRSSAPRIKTKSRRTKSGKKKINVLGNAVIAQNWDKRQTLTQNYRRLGLATRLNAPTGGVDKRASNRPADNASEPLAISGNRGVAHIQPDEARVERDPKTGKILRIVRPSKDEDDRTIEVAGRKRRRANPLNDPLEDLSENEGVTLENINVSTEVVVALEKQAATEEEKLKKRKPRHQSKREVEWLELLVEKYGDNVPAMARDRKLNPMQQTEGELRRKLKKLTGNKE